MKASSHEVFIAHKRADAEIALALHEGLSKAGISTFCDSIDDPRATLGDQIYDTIRDSKVFLFTATDQALVSLNQPDSWLSRELRCAREANLSLVLVRVLQDPLGPQHEHNRENEKLPQAGVTCSRGELLTTTTVRAVVDLVRSSQANFGLDLAGFFPSPSELKKLIPGILEVVGDERQKERLLVDFNKSQEIDHFASSLINRKISTTAAEIPDNPLWHLVSRALVIGTLRNLSHARANRQRVPTDVRSLWPFLRLSLSVGGRIPLRVTRSSQGFYIAPLFSVVIDGKVRELLRLHYWPAVDSWAKDSSDQPMNARTQSSHFRIHSHQAFAQSWLLAGEILNFSYKVLRESETVKDNRLSLFSVSWDGKQSYDLQHRQSALKNTGRLVNVLLDNYAVFRPGSSYSIAAGDFHSTRSGLAQRLQTATIFYFDSTQGWVDDAPVVGPATKSASAPHNRLQFSDKLFLQGLDRLIDMA